MTRGYEETRWNNDIKQREHVAGWSFTVYPQDNIHLTVCRDGELKTIKVVEDSEFVYKLQKTQVKAIGGAAGIFKFLDDELMENSSSCFAWKILKHCFYNCKEAA